VRLVVALIVGAALFVWLWFSPLFKIQSVTVSATEHTSLDELGAALAVSDGTTLLSLDEKALQEKVLALPWVASVKVEREFPHTLHVEVTERSAAAVVLMTNGTEAWRIALDGTWLEPVELQEVTATNGAAAPSDQARAVAASEGLAFVCDLGEYAEPVAGQTATQEVVLGVLAYLEGFSPDFAAQIELFRASSTPGIAAMLTSGIEVSLGSPVDIELKERVIDELLSRYAGQVTYINVRTPTMPTWRGLDAAGDASGGSDASDGEDGSGDDGDTYGDEDDVSSYGDDDAPYEGDGDPYGDGA
jgi:cell division protein FtsQ